MEILTTFSTFIGKIIALPLIGLLTLAGYPLQAPIQPITETKVNEIVREQILDYNDYVRKQIDDFVKQSRVLKEPVLGAAPDYVAGLNFNLSGAGISSSATSITLQSLTIQQTGQEIVTADLIAGAGNKFYITIEPGNRTRQEVVSCTAIAQSSSNNTATLSGCSRGLSPITPYTSSTTLQFSHAGGSQVIFSNPPQVYRDLVDYIDAASIAGAVDSSATAKGIVEKATAAEAAAHAGIGSGGTTAPLALTSDIASSTRTADTFQVIVASTTGYIDNSYLRPEIASSSIKVATSTGTWNKPSKLKFIIVEVIGGGGGGAGAGTNNTGGGGYGDFNSCGGGGGSGSITSAGAGAGSGGSSYLGGGARGTTVSELAGIAGGYYGGGGSGGVRQSGDVAGGAGAVGIVVIQEVYF